LDKKYGKLSNEWHVYLSNYFMLMMHCFAVYRDEIWQSTEVHYVGYRTH